MIRIKSGKTKIKCEEARTSFQKFKGLMLKRNIKPMFFDFGIDSRNRCALHTLFMLCPIDVLFINSRKKIVDIKTVKPWKFLIKPKDPARYVLELPKGMGGKFEVGKKLEIK